MKPTNAKFRVLLFAVPLLAIVVGISLFANIALKGQIAQLNQDSKVLEENFNALKKSLELLKNENQELKDSNSKLLRESASLSSAMKSTKIEVEQALEKLNDFETTVKNSIKWFRENTNIQNYSEYEKIRKELDACLQMNENCNINLKCIYDVNKKNGIRYRYDEDTTGKEDFLKDLKLIYEQYGGDCEDFSLLYRAEFNYLMDKCLINYTLDYIYSIATDPKTDNSFRIDEDYMSIICGTFDPKEVIGNVAGHCLNALTKNPIKSSDEIYSQITYGVMVEPQLGEFYGYMNSTEHIKIFDDGTVPDTLYYLDFVITDDDLYIYNPYSEKVKWGGYHDFLEESAQIKSSVEK